MIACGEKEFERKKNENHPRLQKWSRRSQNHLKFSPVKISAAQNWDKKLII